RRELNLPGALSGRVQGELDFSSTSPSPLDYSGVGSLTIEDGYLGTVPVLSALWESGGIQPPTFKSGKLLFKAHPKKHYGRIRLEEFDLHHDLLTVTGQGWLGMDGYLDLKATLRSGLVPIIGWGIPLISDLFFDPLVEQDVFGPLDRPIVRQRVLHKLTESNQKRIPLLLSFPILEREDWQRSPAWPPLISPSD
ncbi:MAG: hypothetical protein MK213_07070, partial [Planctomycetes bacterium]|nr:hypothetical protein [Planctomycetota bacterium]